ncbi:6,7-dimethyl-8-ribityllumazine synthase [Dinoroseobacter sp. S375]|uniref:6,7-dimethyl-8-ribityllumazine synthase n=1 Tax=Dinoroseobacter sp. S375 TaxID=3415136 RepID=UPI003C7DA78D
MAQTDAHTELPTPQFDKPVKLLIVQSPYYKEIAEGLLTGAKAVLDAAGASYDVVQMPGALEIPPAIRIAHVQSNYDGYVALGCVIRGETTHYETVCNDSSHGLMLLGLQGACLGNGILTVENAQQALVRADPEGQNKGGGAAAAALHLIALSRSYASETKGVGFKPKSETILVAGRGEGTTTA